MAVIMVFAMAPCMAFAQNPDSDVPETAVPPLGEDSKPLGKGSSYIAADAHVTSQTSDDDPDGTVFDPLKVRSTVQAKKNITIKWEKQLDAASYIIYSNRCGADNKMEQIGETDKATYQVKGLKKGTYHKFLVVALGPDNKVVTTSKIIHVATKGGKVGNYKNVTIKVKKGKKFKAAASAAVDTGAALNTKVVAKKASKKGRKHVGIRYESSDEAVATADAGGVITGVSPGTCQITAYAQNGVYKVLKLTVK